jgi:iron complex transport system ATP-binding protein
VETIRLKDLSIGYPMKKGTAKVVASGIDATIYSGQLTCLLGANGVGKSTLLRTLSAFQPALSGEIFIEDTDIRILNSKEMSKKISVVLTGKPDVMNITAAELVGLGRSPYTGFWGSLSREDDEIVMRAMRMVGIEWLKDRMIQTLSDGERQKVMIAKALAQQTPIIFLDEPTAFLDFPSKVEMMQLLRRLAHEMDKTIFLSTHDLELALQIADMLWMMNKTQGLSIGTPRELAERGILSQYIEKKGILFDKDTLAIRVI